MRDENIPEFGYKVEAYRWHNFEKRQPDGRVREKDVLTSMVTDDLEKAYDAVRLYCATMPEAEEVSLEYYEGSYSDHNCLYNDKVWEDSYFLECFHYPFSRVEEYIEDNRAFRNGTYVSKYPDEPLESDDYDDWYFREGDYVCTIIGRHETVDESGWVDESEEIDGADFEHYEDAMAFLKQLSENPKVNSIELSKHIGSMCEVIGFYRQEHPYSECDMTFDEIDDFILHEKENHEKMMSDPDPLDFESMYIDLLAGITPEMMLRGETPEQIMSHIPQGEKQLKKLFNMLAKKDMPQERYESFMAAFDSCLPFFWDGLKTAAEKGMDYWIRSWKEGELDGLHEDFMDHYLNMELTDTQRNLLAFDHNNAFYYYYMGLYFPGLAYYAA